MGYPVAVTHNIHANIGIFIMCQNMIGWLLDRDVYQPKVIMNLHTIIGLLSSCHDQSIKMCTPKSSLNTELQT